MIGASFEGVCRTGLLREVYVRMVGLETAMGVRRDLSRDWVTGRLVTGLRAAEESRSDLPEEKQRVQASKLARIEDCYKEDDTWTRVENICIYSTRRGETLHRRSIGALRKHK
jgi:hypothetical protein